MLQSLCYSYRNLRPIIPIYTNNASLIRNIRVFKRTNQLQFYLVTLFGSVMKLIVNTQSTWPYFLAAFNHTKWLKRYSQEPLITLLRIDTCLLLTLKMALSKGCYLLMTIYDAIAQPLYHTFHIIMYCISIPN